MDNLVIIQFILTIILQITIVILFVYRLKYMQQYGLTLWGVYLTMEIIALLVSIAFSQYVFLSVLSVSVSTLFNNIFIIFKLGIILLLFHEFQNTKDSKNVLLAIFLIFFFIWIIEFMLTGLENIDALSYAIVFSKVAIISLCWNYLFNIYKHPLKAYKSIPFFWIVLGWLFYNTLTIPADLPEFDSDSQLFKFINVQLFSLLSVIALIFYAIGFWKTKSWSLNNVD